jgi:hypothetical protein
MPAHARFLNITLPPGLCALLVAALLGAVATPAEAQGELERLRQEIERTDDAIARAQQVVAASESERARGLLANAIHLQERAWFFFGECDLSHLRACRAAAESTVRSRREAMHAIQVAREESSAERAAQQTIDRSQRWLDEAFDVVREEGAPSDAALRLLEQSENQLGRAREQYRERQFVIALRLANNARNLIRRALALDDVDGFGPELVRRELERTRRLLERAAPIVRTDEDERSARLFEQALGMQERAGRMFEEERFLAAFKLTREARKLVQRALRLVNDVPVDADVVKQAIDQTDALIERVAPVVRESGLERAMALLERGIGRQQRAKELVTAEDLEAALAQTRVARNLVSEAHELAGREGGAPE